MRINPHDLDWNDAHDIMTEIVTPRPIAFISTISEGGINNLAPYSLFCPMCHVPMIVGFSVGRKKDGQKKDTLVNIETTKEYVINVVTESLAAAMVRTAGAYPPEVDEFVKSGLTPAAAQVVKAPIVVESPINMECKLLQILEFGSPPRCSNFVVGELVSIHIKDEFIVDGQIDPLKLKTIGRLGGGGSAYCRTTDMFEIRRQ